MAVNNTNPNKSTIKQIELFDPSLPDESNQIWGESAPHDAQTSRKANIMQEVLSDLQHELGEAAPWFFSQMPPLYHRITPWNEKREHLIEIISGRALSHGQLVERVNSETQTVTILGPGKNGISAVITAPQFLKSKAKFGSIFQSTDDKLAICSLHCSKYSTEKNWDSKQNLLKKKDVQELLKDKNQGEVEKYLSCLDSNYIEHSTGNMMAIGFDAMSFCDTNEQVFINLTEINEGSYQGWARVDVGMKGMPVITAIENIVGIFGAYNFTVRRVLCSDVFTPEREQLVIMHILINREDGVAITADIQPWGRALKALKTLTYVDNRDEFSVLMQGPNPRSINETNFIRAVSNWTHVFLSKVNPYYYTLDRCSRMFLKNEAFMDDLIKYFRAKFDPRFKGNREKDSAALLSHLESSISATTDDIEKNVLKESVNFTKNILKCNYFVISKGALAFRMDPVVLNKTHYPETPYGFFYMMGKGFRAFQVRYNDIARGGVRIVLPRSSADFESALAGLFDEVNGLAFAQQLKNKDIPEGGSKCVFVVRPGEDHNLALKSGISGLLDLIIVDGAGKLVDGIIDYYKKEEVIYLGPDENMTEELIEWVTEHAIHRGYRYGWAFMSSKPGFGINHKKYGVTSEGLNVYVDNVLRYLKLNGPDTKFRVKMTGGPDGDVAGNELKILFREYGERCRVVAVGDGFGAAYDPNGLNWKELLRLVTENKSISEFQKQFLSSDSKAFVILANTKENQKIRDTLYATAEAEIFIPAGGRPYTVKESNWRNFLDKDGRPSSIAIVEGANIFFTPEARKNIVNSGCVVIKDSSANKGGVIASSFEIIACLTLSPEEFAGIKDVYVGQVVEILRRKADLEAKLLFAEYLRRGHEVSLVEISYEISESINKVTEVIRHHMESLSDQDLNRDSFISVLNLHCPAVLVEKYRERIPTRLPRAHRIAIISAYIASRLIYKEGLNWLKHLEDDQIFKIALEYVTAEQQVEQVIAEVSNSQLAQRDLIISVLKTSGAKHIASSSV